MTLELSLGRLEMCVHDDGTGIGATTLAHGRPGHFGMAGMRERAERVGATLEIVCDGSTGTKATLTLPRGHGANLESRWWRRVIGPLRD